jgi:hypothetical protein
MKFKQALDFGRAFDFRRALTWLNWLYGCVFGAICLGYGIAFAGHALSLWELPHLSPLFTAFSFGSAGCANLVSGLQKLSPAAAPAHGPISAAGARDSEVNKEAAILRT